MTQHEIPMFNIEISVLPMQSLVDVLLLRIIRHPLEDDDIMLVFFPEVQLDTGKKGRFLYVFDRARSQPAPVRLPAISLVVQICVPTGSRTRRAKTI